MRKEQSENIQIEDEGRKINVIKMCKQRLPMDYLQKGGREREREIDRGKINSASLFLRSVLRGMQGSNLWRGCEGIRRAV